MQKIILEGEVIQELIDAWLEENEDALEEVDDWTGEPTDDVIEIGTDAAMTVMDQLKQADYDVQDQEGELVQAFVEAFAEITAATEADFEDWKAGQDAEGNDEEDDDEMGDEEP